MALSLQDSVPAWIDTCPGMLPRFHREGKPWLNFHRSMNTDTRSHPMPEEALHFDLILDNPFAVAKVHRPMQVPKVVLQSYPYPWFVPARQNDKAMHPAEKVRSEAI